MYVLYKLATVYLYDIMVNSLWLYSGALIRLIGYEDYLVVFPPWEISGTLEVRVHSLSDVEAFNMEKSDGGPHDQQILLEFLGVNTLYSTYVCIHKVMEME